MSKTVTLRLSEKDYEKISMAANDDRRPISNFITTVVIEEIEKSYLADSIEMAQIKSDKDLLKRLKEGHSDASEMKGKLVE